MVEDRSNNNIIEMLALSEDISTINLKLKEYIKTLHGDATLLGNTKEMASRLFEKVKTIDKKISSFRPITPTEATMGTPSYVEEGIKPLRVVPGPDDFINENDIESIPLAILEKEQKKVNIQKQKKPLKKPTKPTKKSVAKKTKQNMKVPLTKEGKTDIDAMKIEQVELANAKRMEIEAAKKKNPKKYPNKGFKNLGNK